jgi:hypothetical protein
MNQDLPNQTKKTTPLLDNEIITITHPFLPNSGKKYFLIGRLKVHGKEKLLCQDLNGSEVLIQIECTDLKKQDPFQEQATGRSDFLYDDLWSLVGLLEEIRKNV